MSYVLCSFIEEFVVVYCDNIPINILIIYMSSSMFYEKINCLTISKYFQFALNLVWFWDLW